MPEYEYRTRHFDADESIEIPEADATGMTVETFGGGEEPAIVTVRYLVPVGDG